MGVTDNQYPYPERLGSAITANSQLPSASGTQWAGGSGHLSIFGTFDTSSSQLQVKDPESDSSDWVDVGAVVTEKAMLAFTLPEGVLVRVDLSSVGGSTSLDFNLIYNIKV